MRYIEFKKFKKENQIDFVDWNKPAVKVGGLWYKIKFINIDGTHYPYIMLPKIKIEKTKYTTREFSEQIKQQVKLVNEYKSQLKNISYLVGNDEYFVVGIGSKSIKAFKNEETKPKYLWFNTKEGQKLLGYLITKIGQTKIAIING